MGIVYDKLLAKKYRFVLDGPKDSVPKFETRYYAQKFIDDLIKDHPDATMVEKGDDGYYYIFWKLPFGLVIDEFPW